MRKFTEREKWYAVYEKKIDKDIDAGKPVKKELDSIRSTLGVNVTSPASF